MVLLAISAEKQAHQVEIIDAELRNIAPFIRANTQKMERVSYYKLSYWNPTHAMMFYTDRFVGKHSLGPENLLEQMEENPTGTWLANIEDFKNADNSFPQKLYLIYGNEKFAYFTSIKNRKNVVYDLSNMIQPVVR